MATTAKPPIGEFDLIRRYFRPLAAAAPDGLELRDDAAVTRLPPGRELVTTADAMVAGVHFLPDDPPDLVGRKLLRVNLSDLASMGAKPHGYLLTTAWPTAIDERWIAAFCQGLARDQDEYGIALLGGDTVRTPGPLVLSLTALGTVPERTALRRDGAQVGDAIYVSGSLGDAALGLAVLRGQLATNGADELKNRYRLPRPRLSLGRALRGVAHAAIDISDGFLADLGHLLEESKVGARVRRDQLPLSAAAAAIERSPDFWRAVIAGGDDYELLFTAPASWHPASEIKTRTTQVGHIVAGEGVQLLDEAGESLEISDRGYRHF